MAETLGSLIIEVLRVTGQNPNKSALSDADHTQWLADRFHEAFQLIYGLTPFQVELDGTITLTASTRKYDIPAGVDPYRIHPWSWRIDDANGDIKVAPATLEFVVNTRPDYETAEGDCPDLVYFDANKIAVSPMPKAGSANKTLQFIYQAQYTKAVWATTFPFADQSNELQFAKKFAQYHYQKRQGLGDSDETYDAMTTYKGLLKVEYARGKRMGRKGRVRF